MYNVTLQDLNVKGYVYPYLELLAENHEDLRAIVTLAPEAGYEIVKVEPTMKPLQTVSEFLEEIKDKIKPKDLVFGIDTADPTFSTGNQSTNGSDSAEYPSDTQITPTLGNETNKKEEENV